MIEAEEEMVRRCRCRYRARVDFVSFLFLLRARIFAAWQCQISSRRIDVVEFYSFSIERRREDQNEDEREENVRFPFFQPEAEAIELIRSEQRTMLSSLRDRSLCLFNSDGTPTTCQPWSTIADAEFHPDVSALYKPTNVNPIQSIQIDYLPPWISYLWPLVHHGKQLWAVDHPTVSYTHLTLPTKRIV